MTEYGSGGIGGGLVHQHDWDAVPDRVDAAALGTLQTLSLVFQHQRLLADWAHQDVEQVLGNHGRILRFSCQPARTSRALTAKSAKKCRKDRNRNTIGFFFFASFARPLRVLCASFARPLRFPLRPLRPLRLSSFGRDGLR
jgi:hypothetical protein